MSFNFASARPECATLDRAPYSAFNSFEINNRSAPSRPRSHAPLDEILAVISLLPSPLPPDGSCISAISAAMPKSNIRSSSRFFRREVVRRSMLSMIAGDFMFSIFLMSPGKSSGSCNHPTLVPTGCPELRNPPPLLSNVSLALSVYLLGISTGPSVSSGRACLTIMLISPRSRALSSGSCSVFAGTMAGLIVTRKTKAEPSWRKVGRPTYVGAEYAILKLFECGNSSTGQRYALGLRFKRPAIFMP